VQNMYRGMRQRGLYSGAVIPNESDAPAGVKSNVEGKMKTIWMTLIEEEDVDLVRELEVLAFDNPERVWRRLSEYAKEKANKTLDEFLEMEDEPRPNLQDPDTYARTWNVDVGEQTIHIHVLRMTLLEGEEVGGNQS